MLYRRKKVKKWLGLNKWHTFHFWVNYSFKRLTWIHAEESRENPLTIKTKNSAFQNETWATVFFFCYPAVLFFRYFLVLHVTLSDLVFDFSKYKLLENFNKPDSLLFMISKQIPVWNPVNMQSRPVVLSWFCFGSPCFNWWLNAEPWNVLCKRLII